MMTAAAIRRAARESEGCSPAHTTHVMHLNDTNTVYNQHSPPKQPQSPADWTRSLCGGSLGVGRA